MVRWGVSKEPHLQKAWISAFPLLHHLAQPPQDFPLSHLRCNQGFLALSKCIWDYSKMFHLDYCGSILNCQPIDITQDMAAYYIIEYSNLVSCVYYSRISKPMLEMQTYSHLSSSGKADTVSWWPGVKLFELFTLFASSCEGIDKMTWLQTTA